MSEKMMKKGRVALTALLAAFAVAALTLWGCGDSGTKGYTDVTAQQAASITTTKTANAAIDPATLKQWMDEGKVNSSNAASLDRVVIVTVAPLANYAALHIPGAQLLNSASELSITRMEGVGTNTSEVLTGQLMDALVQRFGITKNTTVVFTVSKGQSLMNATRAYYTFRYWGFPRERLKVLNGGDDAWNDAATANSWSSDYALTATVPTITASTFSVRNFYTGSTSNFNVRYSIGDMLALVDKINSGTLKTDASGVSIIDARGGVSATTGVYIQNSIEDNYASYWTAATGKTGVLNSPSAQIAYLTAEGVTAAKKMNYVYCASGFRASVPFFVLDGMLTWPVTLYDGSWQQWQSYLSTATANKVAAVWQTDALTSGTTISRTFNGSGAALVAGTSITLDAASNAMYTSISDSRANQQLIEDKAYFTSGTSSSTTPSSGSGGGTGSGC
ncbi:selenite/tellurite reduction operon rhodanese-like protein ExtH [Oryzomonas rubra]|uniref:Rhodanese domain-containing protein n=1 Tax=Oryzomonas rubra TaxID=2509454 RepID=A0A5A9X6P3_9BACT|nr:selenite/tellurite reduction operon rhodanese-like protein ExtH [Oryzomonas rubra]KAA0888343.1 hypothetical protein ET418_16555 [Oryzomonas rubra]